MRRIPAAFATLLLTASVAVLAAPDSYADSIPHVTSVTPNPVDPDGTLQIVGDGCSAASPVSFYLWSTSGGPPPVYLDDATTSDGTGGFTYSHDLASHFDPGSGIGVGAACGATYAGGTKSSPYDDQSYVLVKLPDPVVRIVAPARVAYGPAKPFTVHTSNTSGALTVTVDGSPLTQGADSTWVDHAFMLPARLTPGIHHVRATFDPSIDGPSTVHDTAAVTVKRASGSLTLSFAEPTVEKGRQVRAKVHLVAPAGLARSGVVTIKDGAKVVKRFHLRARDHGSKHVRVRFERMGKRKLTARFHGNSQVTGATSPPSHVKVTRRR